jgi:hypothetical protein
MRLAFVLAILAAGVAVFAACGGGDDSPALGAGTPVSTLTVRLTNWAVTPSSRTLAAGKVTVTAVHVMDHMDSAPDGGATHQLLIAPLPAGAKAGQGKYGKPVLNLTDLKMGDEKTAEVDLAPGTYELFCSVVEDVKGKTVNHYEKGMYTTVVAK